MNMKSLNILFILCVFLFLGVSARKKKDCCECPPLVPPGDMNDPAVILGLSRNTVKKLWSNKEPPLTKNAKKLSKILIKLSQTNNTYWQSTANVASLWIWAFLPELNSTKPTMCSFAKIIDGTVDWLRTGDCKNLEDPIRDVGKTCRDSSRLVALEALENSKCLEYGTECNGCEFDLAQAADSVITETCPYNGAKYKIKKYIKEIKPYYPRKLICLLKEMYKSCEYQDNLIAAITLASASPVFQSSIDGFNNEIKYTHFHMQSTGAIPACCCKAFCSKLRTNLAAILIEGPRTVEAALSEFCCEQFDS